MTEERKNEVIVILASILGVLIVVIFAVFVMPFVLMIIVWGGDGKLDDEEKISVAVMENQETLEDIVSQLLEPEQDLDFALDTKEKEFRDLSISKDTDEELYNLEDIYRSADDLEILRIYVVKDSDVDMVIFETYADGMVGSGSESGFVYLEQDWSDDIFEYDNFKGWRKYDHSKITNHWHYYKLVI